MGCRRFYRNRIMATRRRPGGIPLLWYRDPRPRQRLLEPCRRGWLVRRRGLGGKFFCSTQVVDRTSIFTNDSPGLVEADVERELEDERHELRRNEMRKLRDEGRKERRAVCLLICLPAARGLDLLQVRVRAVRSPI